MKRARVIPILLIKNKGLYKSVRFGNGKYIGDPINAVRILNEKECDELIIVDTDVSKVTGEIEYKLISEIATECFMPLTYGGGVQNLWQIEKLLKLGVEKISLNSSVLRNPSFLKMAVDNFGSSTIVASLDIKKNLLGQYRIFSHSSIKQELFDLDDILKFFNEQDVGEVLVNSVDLDGTQKGYDINLANRIAGKLTMPVVFAGGCRDMNDIKKLLTQTQISAAAAGSMFVFHGSLKAVLISYPQPEVISGIYQNETFGL